jgi:hypothetical protein
LRRGLGEVVFRRTFGGKKEWPMMMRTSVLGALLLGAGALLLCRPASAQGPSRQAEELGLQADLPPELAPSPALAAGWWRAITDELDLMRGLRGRRVLEAAAQQVHLLAAPAATDRLALYEDVLVTRPLSRRLELHLGPVRGTPVWIEPVTLSDGDARGETGQLLGVEMPLPWMVP